MRRQKSRDAIPLMFIKQEKIFKKGNSKSPVNKTNLLGKTWKFSHVLILQTFQICRDIQSVKLDMVSLDNILIVGGVADILAK